MEGGQFLDFVGGDTAVMRGDTRENPELKSSIDCAELKYITLKSLLFELMQLHGPHIDPGMTVSIWSIKH